MISPEMLRRFPFFGWIDPDHLREIAQISEERVIEEGVTLFEEGESADWLYFLISGSVDLFFKIAQETSPEARKEYYSGSINPGEAFAISALIKPNVYVATARTSATCNVLCVDARALRQMLQDNPGLWYPMMEQIARVALQRLTTARIQLAAAWS